MTTNAKAGKTTKKAKCKMASPISNDRAEAFVGPQAEFFPRFSEVPAEREAKAFRLAAKGMTQREIAKELKTSQPTVQRAIKKYRFWFGSTLPEDRGELVGWQRFRVAVEERRIFLRHQQELAMEEWHQSRQPTPMVRERTKVYPEGRKSGGKQVTEVITDKYWQKRHASAAHFNAAAKRSEELTMLEAGYLGVHKLTCDQVIDVDERDRWDRAVKSYKATIEDLTRKVAELETKLAAVRPGSGLFGTSDSPLSSTPQPKSPDPLARQPGNRVEPGAQPRGTGVFGGCVIPPAQSPSPKTEGPDQSDESRTPQTTPAVNQTSHDSEVASPIENAPSGNLPESGQPVSQKAESDESKATPPQPAPTYRWGEAERQEALDYHCQINNLPRAKLSQASGVPDPLRVTPLEHVKRGRPYIISIDYSEEARRFWERHEREMKQRPEREQY